MRSVLLIGFEGYIGNIVSLNLLKEGYRVCSYDNLLHKNHNCVLNKIISNRQFNFIKNGFTFLENFFLPLNNFFNWNFLIDKPSDFKRLINNKRSLKKNFLLITKGISFSPNNRLKLFRLNPLIMFLGSLVNSFLTKNHLDFLNKRIFELRVKGQRNGV